MMGLIYVAFVLYIKLNSKNEKFLNFSKWTKYLIFILVFIQLGENNNISLELMELLSQNISNIKAQLLQMAYSSVRRRTAQTLLQFADIMSTNKDEAIKISRNDLASVAGIATESLIRTLSGFKKEGLITIEGRNIHIKELKALQYAN